MGASRFGVLGVLVLTAFSTGCFSQATPGGSTRSSATQPGARASDEQRDFPLDKMETATIQVAGKPVRVWLARTGAEQQEGLMFVPPEELEGDVGMLFVFRDEAMRFFWMKNTITSLDIAYARFDGRIVSTHTMPPLTLQNFPSIEPAMFALEMKAGSFARLGVHPGDRIVIPSDIFEPSP